LDVHKQLSIVRRWIPLLVISVVLVGVVAYLVSSSQPKVYEARATLIVGESLSGVNPDYNQLLVSQRLSATYASIATTHQIMAGVVGDLGLTTDPDSLATRVFVATSPDTALLTISARDHDAQTAADIANTVAKRLIDASPAVRGQDTQIFKSIEQDLAAIRDDITTTQGQIQDLLAKTDRTPTQESTLQALQSRLVSLRSTYATLLTFTTNDAANLLTIVQPALPPSNPISPRPIIDALLAAVVALVVISGLVFLYEYIDDALRDPEDVSETLGLPTLGRIERMRGDKPRKGFYRLVAILYPRSPAAEAYRSLRTNLDFAALDRPIRSLLVTSAVPNEGKTVTASNLAVVAAQGGRRVLLVDADLRRPGVHKLFNIENGPGFADLIRNPQISPGSVTQATEQAGLWILTTGSPPPNPTEVLASQRARDLFDVMGMEFDLLIADSPPIQVFADAPILSSFMDGTLLVVESRRGRRTQLRQAQAALVRAGANVVGVVLNRVSPEANPTYAMYFDPGSDAAGPGQQGDLGSDQVVPVGVSPDRSPGPRRRSGRESTASNPEQG
jgi:capsular exopolysaccharide synthesis family protein